MGAAGVDVLLHIVNGTVPKTLVLVYSWLEVENQALVAWRVLSALPPSLSLIFISKPICFPVDGVTPIVAHGILTAKLYPPLTDGIAYTIPVRFAVPYIFEVLAATPQS